MNLRQKLILAFGIVVLIPLVGGAIGIFAYREASRSAQVMLDAGKSSRVLVDSAREAEVHFKLQVQEWKNLLLRGADPSAYDNYLANFHKNEKGAQDALAEAASLAPNFAIDVAIVEELKRSHLALGAAYRTALENFPPGSPNWAAQLDQAVAGIDRKLADELGALVDVAVKKADGFLETEATKLAERSRILNALMIGGTFLGIALGAAFGWMTINAVSRHIADVSRRMWDGTIEIAAAADQVASSSERVADASSQQAAALEETSAAIAEVHATVKQNAANAQTAYEISQASRATADASVIELRDMQDAMQAMGTASSRIAQIVSSIDEIAFQTNILALNAAVEAARAGEAGAGFAVVADEVRSLAQRSAQAARQTAELIEDAVAKGARGQELANRVSQSLNSLIEDTRRTDGLIAEIAQASQEQTKGLDQVVTSTARIDQLTQSNAAASEETAAAARELNAQMTGFQNELQTLLNARSTDASTPKAPSTDRSVPPRVHRFVSRGHPEVARSSR